MKAYLKKLGIGRSTSALFVAGLLMLLLLFRAKKNTSAMELDRLIQRILIDSGYSPNMARLVAAVSRHETDNYTSHVFQTLNNMFGMRFPHERDTTALYESDTKYSVYASHADSVRDLVLYFRARLYPTHFDSAHGLVTAMKQKRYFEDGFENYLRGVERALPKVAAL